MDGDPPLASSAKERSRKKASKRKSASPKRRKTKRPALRVYGLDGKLLENDVTNLQDFLASHTKELPAKVGFVMLGSYPIMIEKQAQLEALPAGEYNAQVLYAHPTQAQLEAFQRRKQTSGVSKASRLK